MSTYRSALIVLFIASSCIGCDQLTKTYARQQLDPGARMVLAGGMFLIQYEENHGGMLSVGAELSPRARFWIFTVVVGAFLVGVMVYAVISESLPNADRVAMGFITGGGFGNLIDRVGNGGAVIDFLNVGFGGVRTATFNVADVAVVLGAAMLIMRVFVRLRHEE